MSTTEEIVEWVFNYKSDSGYLTPIEVSLTRKILPPCSMNGCDHAAAAVMDGALYCGSHAVEKLRTRVPRGEQALRTAPL